MSLIGKLIYNSYYRPKQKRATLQKFGGKKSYQEMLQAEQEMKQYALEKITIAGPSKPDGKYRLNFLTGDKFIHQSLFCTYSFFKFLTKEEAADFEVNYYSDGNLSNEIIATIKSRFPFIKITGHDEMQALVQKFLPANQFPWLHKKMALYPPIKKLIYPNLNRKGSSVFFDSDMLFLKRPEAFLNWICDKGGSDDTAFGIHDVQRSYGYSDNEIMNAYPPGINDNINSGMYAIDSEKIDLAFAEELIKKLETAYGSQYYIEQVVTAIILEQSPRLILAPSGDYIVKPSTAQCAAQQGVLHHYVDESKAFYFKEGWRKQLADQ